MNTDIERVLFSEDEILAGMERIAARVTDDYRGSDLAVVAILKGSCIFASDLIRRIPIPMHLAFVYAESYRRGTEPGELELSLMPSADEVDGRRVLLIDDILDSGRTLSRVRAELMELGASDVRSCVFLDKNVRRAVDFEADYVCFEVGDHFVVGYGLDFGGRYRNLPYVGSLRSEIIAES